MAFGGNTNYENRKLQNKLCIIFKKWINTVINFQIIKHLL